MKKKNIITAAVGGALAIAAGIFFWKKKHKDHDEVPKDAPQVPVENPGQQSEFPAAPTGEPDLG